jgi:hypothetical protein
MCCCRHILNKHVDICEHERMSSRRFLTTLTIAMFIYRSLYERNVYAVWKHDSERRNTEVLREKPVILSPCPPQIPHRRHGNQTQYPALKLNRVTAWSVEWLSSSVFDIISTEVVTITVMRCVCTLVILHSYLQDETFSWLHSLFPWWYF